MAVRLPTVNIGGQFQNLPAGDTIATGISEGRAVPSGGSAYLQLPWVQPQSVSTLALTAGRIYYAPLIIPQPIGSDQLIMEVATAVAATNIRFGLYAANFSWQPVTLLADSGTISSATAQVNTVTLGTPVVLAPGNYLTSWQSDGAPTMRVLRGGFTPIATTVGSSPLIKAWYATGQTFGPMPTTPVLWTNTTPGTTPFEHAVFLRVSTP